MNQLVLRVDPIIPNNYGIAKACNVLKLFQDTGIRRVRYSFLDMYPHVKDRFTSAGLELPYNSFNAPTSWRKVADENIHQYDYEFESCAENNKDSLGCISKKDYDILGIKFVEGLQSNQRKSCLCVNKKELLSNCSRCSHQCIYCYWK